MPADTRAKMSQAHQGRRKLKATRAKMSEAKKGHTVSDETRAAISSLHRGVPKTPEHRAKIAEAARRRHAATRVLLAVEAVHAAASQAVQASGAPAPRARAPGAGSGGAVGGAPASSSSSSSAGGAAASPPPRSGLAGASPPAGAQAPAAQAAAAAEFGAVRAAAYSLGLSSLADSKTGRRVTRDQILKTFQAELREFRNLQVRRTAQPAACAACGNWEPALSSPAAGRTMLLWRAAAGSCPLAPPPPLPAAASHRLLTALHVMRARPALAACRTSCRSGARRLWTCTGASPSSATCSTRVRGEQGARWQQAGAGLAGGQERLLRMQRADRGWAGEAGRALQAAHCATPPSSRAPNPPCPVAPRRRPPAGIPWLIERFKQYMVLRDRLFSDGSVLRGKLKESIPGAPRAWGAAWPSVVVIWRGWMWVLLPDAIPGASGAGGAA